MKNIIVIIVVVFLGAASIFAQDDMDVVETKSFVYDEGGRRDPFWPLVTESGSIISYDEQEISASDMMLQGILAGDQENVAVINGKIVKEGDMVGAFRIEKVTLTYVILDNGKEKIEVYLRKEE